MAMTQETQTSAPPKSLWESLAHLGPGIILASSIVGSGELIATTTVGAEAGFALLWLIVIGCAIKVAAQVEIGRNTVTWGRTPLDAFDRVPGPRLGGRNWIYWGWAMMTLLIVVQQGGIVAGVAQSLAAGVPLTAEGRAYNDAHNAMAAAEVEAAVAQRQGDAELAEAATARLAELTAVAAELPDPSDVAMWTVIAGVVTAVLLAVSQYWLIERVSIALVGTFTLMTILAVVLLQADPTWAISSAELISGVVPSVPPSTNGQSPISTALAALGIIGVGAAELMFYPYWCLEKGYAKAIGPRNESQAWTARARGWLRVMQLDAWGSMVVYTVVTIAFYLLGAATLGRLGLRPAGSEMVRTLGQMYVPIFGEWVREVFLLGAFAVLYSTFFVAAAGNARLITDGLILSGRIDSSDASRATWVRRLSMAWALVAMGLALFFNNPVAMVLASGIAQAIMLAALAVAVLFFRYRDLDPRLLPTRAWDVLLWVSTSGFFIIAGWTVWQKLRDVFVG
jgi:Mn2+/Fe2+ NRAMP family transporter